MDYTIPGADPTKRYSVQMRVTKTDTCRINHIWSDWSDVLGMTLLLYESNGHAVSDIV